MCHVLISTRGNEFVRLVLQQCINEKLVYFRFREIRESFTVSNINSFYLM